MVRIPWLLLLALACVTATASPKNTPQDNPQKSLDNLEEHWTAVHGMAAADKAMVRDGHAALRLERGPAEEDASVRLAPVSLQLGKRYELSGWIRTDEVEVHDVNRSPIAVGATMAMASMPFDVHSVSLGGTQAWTHESLQFVASRTEDEVVLSVGSGGAFQGKAWFAGVRLEPVDSSDRDWPVREAVQTFGPAYRYPQEGWIYLHIEGAPYERGYQHGHLMAREIPEYMERCAAVLGSKDQWDDDRTTANALFLRGFDQEILEEMRGIAEGASDAGARWKGRKIDLLDIVVANTTVEMGELASAVRATPTGLEGLNFDAPPYAAHTGDSPMDHCSAFAATGPATRDGKMVIGHVTWWPLTLAEQTNVMLDIKPAKGHRMLIQSYPGGIESGTDWYQNDVGVVLTETTIDQTPFNARGTPVAFRARMAIQYSDSIDDVVRILSTQNNGLYTNEWIMGDAKTNEIAMLDLGTDHIKLWRSSKGEWFGDTPGFYWGDNNAKDLTVRLEEYPDPKGDPDFIPFVAGVRDTAWKGLYRQYGGKIDEQFGFLAFRTAPLVAASTMDAKVVTAEMAQHMMVWAEIGRPNQREWLPSKKWDHATDAGLYPSGYALFEAEPSESLRASITENEKTRMIAANEPKKPAAAGAVEASAGKGQFAGRLWRGWLLPASDADTWFVAGSAEYAQVLMSDDVDAAMNAQRTLWRELQANAATPLDEFRRERTRGILYLDALRRRMGDEKFLTLMNEYYSANATKAVTAQSFVEKAGVQLASLDMDGTDAKPGAAYLVNDIWRRLPSVAIVYGTLAEAGANRYTAEQVQKTFLERYESAAPLYKDFEVSDDVLRHRDVVFVGRPEANSALARWADKIALDYGGATFKVNGDVHASEREALILAAANPLDSKHMVLVVAGNSALSTVKAQSAELSAHEYIVFRDGDSPLQGFVEHLTAQKPVLQAGK
jgi:hypothetical protein